MSRKRLFPDGWDQDPKPKKSSRRSETCVDCLELVPVYHWSMFDSAAHDRCAECYKKYVEVSKMQFAWPKQWKLKRLNKPVITRFDGSRE